MLNQLIKFPQPSDIIHDDEYPYNCTCSETSDHVKHMHALQATPPSQDKISEKKMNRRVGKSLSDVNNQSSVGTALCNVGGVKCHFSIVLQL